MVSCSDPSWRGILKKVCPPFHCLFPPFSSYTRMGNLHAGINLSHTHASMAPNERLDNQSTLYTKDTLE